MVDNILTACIWRVSELSSCISCTNLDLFSYEVVPDFTRVKFSCLYCTAFLGQFCLLFINVKFTWLKFAFFSNSIATLCTTVILRSSRDLFCRCVLEPTTIFAEIGQPCCGARFRSWEGRWSNGEKTWHHQCCHPVGCLLIFTLEEFLRSLFKFPAFVTCASGYHCSVKVHSNSVFIFLFIRDILYLIYSVNGILKHQRWRQLLRNIVWLVQRPVTLGGHSISVYDCSVLRNYITASLSGTTFH